MKEGEAEITVLIEHYEGEERWTAHVPLIEGCIAEGSDLDEATRNVVSEIEYFISQDPSLKENLKRKPQFYIAKVNVRLNDLS